MNELFVKKLIAKITRMDFVAVFLQLTLLIIGVVFIYGAGVEIGGDFAAKWYRQIQWIVLGGILYFIIAMLDYRILARYSWVFYVLGLLLLLLTFPLGKTINHARSWIVFSGSIMLQPSELMKPATLIFMAWAVSRPAMRGAFIPLSVPAAVIAFVPVLFILLQPDYGTALVFIPFTVAIIFASGIRWRSVFIICAVGILMIPLFYTFMKPHQKERIKVFLETPANGAFVMISPFISNQKQVYFHQKIQDFFATKNGKKRDNWNALQSLLAVGSGGLTGRGFLKGTQHVLGYLPKTVAPTDFIFSVIAEETGFLGTSFLLGVLACLCLCYCRTALVSRNAMGSFVALGAAVITATHILINIGMTIEAAPIIGIPLPFISYGGSFMLGTMILAGLVQNVYVHRRILQDEEHDED
ncbi:MAG: FtsW/RodA/SpoVE family cell cycle protein [Lentisphaeria bacterium]